MFVKRLNIKLLEANQFITKKVKEKKKEKILLEIAEGYKKRRKEDKIFSDKFRHLDNEGLIN